MVNVVPSSPSRTAKLWLVTFWNTLAAGLPCFDVLHGTASSSFDGEQNECIVQQHQHHHQQQHRHTNTHHRSSPSARAAVPKSRSSSIKRSPQSVQLVAISSVAFLALAALLMLCVVPNPTTAVLVATSKVEKCSRTSEAKEPEGCDTKLVVVLSVASGDTDGTEQVETVVDSAERGSAGCTSSGELSAGDCTQSTSSIADPFLITMRKSRPIAHYTLTYLTTVNNALSSQSIRCLK
jgi:hypothetical protein